MSLLKSLPPRSTRDTDSDIAKKTKSKKKSTTKVNGGQGIMGQIAYIVALVSSKLGKYADEYIILRDEDEVNTYFEELLTKGIGAIDTENSSLDPITCKPAGVCLYGRGMKPAYIPVGHVSHITGALLPNQVSTDVISKWLIIAEEEKFKWVMHNASYDIRVCINQYDVEVTCFWDTMQAAKLLNELESAKLKDLHFKYCDSKDSESITYSSLFSGVTFNQVPISTAYLYAAGDGIKTLDLYDFQKQFITRRKLPGIYNVFTQIEMPMVKAIAHMEDTGISIDEEYSKVLHDKYTALLVEAESNFFNVLDRYKTQLDSYIQNNPGHKLSDPININSPTQIAILIYDVIKIHQIDGRKTGEDVLEKLDFDLGRAILEYRHVAKLLSTYIDKLPNSRNPETRKIHSTQNSMGARTGRQSSSDPNLQNIPSKNKDIRPMFIASEGHSLISCDYSQQEPRILAFLSKDEKLIEAYKQGKDIYAWVASSVYRVDYEDCKEFRPDGTHNPQGKKRRDNIKGVVLGIMYGRQSKSIAEELGISLKEGKQIIDNFYKEYPTVLKFMQDLIQFTMDNGYIETIWGRKCRIPEMMLDPYEFSLTNDFKDTAFDPLCFDNVDTEDISASVMDEYTHKLDKAYGWKQKDAVIKQALSEGIAIKDNTGYIAEATRQVVNSIVQGSAADMTKLAIVIIDNDDILRDLGYKLIIPVHDELIGEAPIELAKQCGERVAQLMIEAAATRMNIPMKCDIVISNCWYGKEV